MPHPQVSRHQLRATDTALSLSNSATLSQNKGKEKDSKRTYEIYRSNAIAKALCVKEDTSLRTEEDCRMAMVLIALLAGGDYVPEGLTAFGT